MKRVVSATTENSDYNFLDTVFVQPKDKDYYTSIVNFLYKWSHLYMSRGYTEYMHVYEVNGEFTGIKDGVPYVVLNDTHQKVLTRKYFDKKYVPVDFAKLKRYYDIGNELSNQFRWREIENMTIDDISAWLEDNHISEFSALK